MYKIYWQAWQDRKTINFQALPVSASLFFTMTLEGVSGPFPLFLGCRFLACGCSAAAAGAARFAAGDTVDTTLSAGSGALTTGCGNWNCPWIAYV